MTNIKTNEHGLPVVDKKREVYLDHAASTPVLPEVFEAMKPYFSERYGNASALYSQGRKAKEALRYARKTIANILETTSGEIIFTASGTESDNLALFGISEKYKNWGNHIITSSIEHHAILTAAEKLEKKGFDVTYLSVDSDGKVSEDSLIRSITPQTTLISIMYANNEIGTIQDIKVLAKVIRQAKKKMGRGPLDPPFFHTDACQATQYLDLDVRKLGVDLMTINSSKIYGPKGAGVLYLRRGIRLDPQVVGGGQEHKMRSGTENIPAIIGFARALEIVRADREGESARLIELRDYMIQKILETIPKTVINGHPTDRLPNNINVSILDIEGEAILLYLDEYGISASTGSACDSSTLDPSHVVLAIGRPYEFAHGSMRFSLGRSTTKDDIDYAISILEPVCSVLRKISPIDVDMESRDRGSMALESAFVGGQTPHFVKREREKVKK